MPSTRPGPRSLCHKHMHWRRSFSRVRTNCRGTARNSRHLLPSTCLRRSLYNYSNLLRPRRSTGRRRNSSTPYHRSTSTGPRDTCRHSRRAARTSRRDTPSILQRAWRRTYQKLISCMCFQKDTLYMSCPHRSKCRLRSRWLRPLSDTRRRKRDRRCRHVGMH